MTTAKDLLPFEDPLEASIAEAVSDTLPVPVDRALDPLTTPARFLPFLAQHKGVRLWYSDWADDRKRQMIAQSSDLAAKVGTRAGVLGFLPFVDAELLDAIAYPARFVMGRSVIGRAPIGHPPFVARYLVKIETKTPPRAFVLGRSVIGRHRLKTPSPEPFRRGMAALRAAKAPDTEYRVDFAHMRPLKLSDGPLLSDNLRLGAFVARTTL